MVVGRTDATGTNRDFGVVRYKDDGTPDTGFGGDGIVTTDFAGQRRPGQRGRRAAGRQDRRRRARHHRRPDARRRRLRARPLQHRRHARHELRAATGSCSPTSARRRTSPAPWSSGPTAASSSPAPPTGTSRSCATPTTARSTTSFGDHGTRVTDFGSDDFANGVALTGDGHILVAGHTLGAGLNLDFALARYTADGDLDTSFGTGGIVKTDFGGDDFAENLTVQPDGRIVVVGRDTSATILDMAVVRYRDDGTLDTGFGAGGKVTADFHGKGEFGQDVAIQPDGKIVAAGYTANGIDTEFALMRINP